MNDRGRARGALAIAMCIAAGEIGDVWETFEHTADIGLRVRAGSLPLLFAEAARGVMSIAVENLAEVAATIPVQIELRADRHEDLLVDWLGELLHTLEHRRLVLSTFSVQIEGERLVANAAGELLDPTRHRMGQEIKAVTYHALKVEHIGSDWVAEVVLDI